MIKPYPPAKPERVFTFSEVLIIAGGEISVASIMEEVALAREKHGFIPLEDIYVFVDSDLELAICQEISRTDEQYQEALKEYEKALAKHKKDVRRAEEIKLSQRCNSYKRLLYDTKCNIEECEKALEALREKPL